MIPSANVPINVGDYSYKAIYCEDVDNLMESKFNGKMVVIFR
jgi:hypothetical protein